MHSIFKRFALTTGAGALAGAAFAAAAQVTVGAHRCTR